MSIGYGTCQSVTEYVRQLQFVLFLFLNIVMLMLMLMMYSAASSY